MFIHKVYYRDKKGNFGPFWTYKISETAETYNDDIFVSEYEKCQKLPYGAYCYLHEIRSGIDPILPFKGFAGRMIMTNYRVKKFIEENTFFCKRIFGGHIVIHQDTEGYLKYLVQELSNVCVESPLH